jgi:hypothetical protein
MVATSLPGRGQHDEGPAPLDDGAVGLAAAATDDALELVALLVGEPPHLHRRSHAQSLRDLPAPVVDAPNGLWSGH